MSSAFFKLTEHKVPCQHIRQYPHATLHSQEEVLYLAVKQYTPLNNPSPQPGDVTILATHGNGFPKELYEPLWDELLQRSSFRIRSIWISDVAHQGWSSVLNEDKLANDPSWLDHSRDLLQLVNSFRDQMPRPIIGVGHSMGGGQIATLSIFHPRLFETIILIDPVIQDFETSIPSARMIPAHLSAMRRDRWTNRKVAEQSFKKSKFYQNWDSRVLDLWLKWGLRDLPTKTYSEELSQTDPYDHDGKEVTLTTTKAQEVFAFLRPASLATWGGNEDALTKDEYQELFDSTFVDLLPAWRSQSSFYRLEPTLIFKLLPFVRPTVLYIFGEHSPVCPPSTRKMKVEATGTGISGSGGAKSGKVKEIVIKDTGHLVAMEKVEDTADAMSPWIGETLNKWKRIEGLLKKYWAGVSEKDQITLSLKRMKVFEGGEKFDMAAPPSKGANSKPKI